MQVSPDRSGGNVYNQEIHSSLKPHYFGALETKIAENILKQIDEPGSCLIRYSVSKQNNVISFINKDGEVEHHILNANSKDAFEKEILAKGVNPKALHLADYLRKSEPPPSTPQTVFVRPLMAPPPTQQPTPAQPM